MKKSVTKVINIILYIILGLVLVANLFILFQAKTNDDKVPAIFGYKPFIVMSGSMENNIMTGDLIFVKTTNPESLVKDDVIAFRTGDNAVVTHRIIDVTEENGEKVFTTKGDNNPSQDSDYVKLSDVEGKYVGRIPKLGKWFLFISKPTGMLVSVLIALVVIMIYAFINIGLDRKELTKEDEEYRKEFEEFKKAKKEKEEIKKKEK